MHGGSVSVQSAGLGHGSEFTVRLPLAAMDSRFDRAEKRAPAEKALAKRRILIVDDNRDGAETLAMLLNFLGSDVRVAYDGPSALETMNAYRPDVVLLDIGMPGMDGYEVAGRVRRDPKLQHLTLIALTGWGQEEDRRRCRQVGIDHHMIKPLDLDALQTLLSTIPPAPR
jgi:CheY-like chemotaxis protein